MAVVCASYTNAVAESKGLDGAAWLCGGLFLGPLALLAAVSLPDVKSSKYLRLIAEHQGAIEPPPPQPPPYEGLWHEYVQSNLP